jgi:hypothetical protein
MNKVLLACAAAAALLSAAPAEDLPKLSEFLTSCYRDNGVCMQKIKNYVEAAKGQKIICLPEDTSVREAANATLSWLRKDENYPASLSAQPFDDGLYEATVKLYPCKSAEPAPPVPPPTLDQPATDQPAPTEQPAAPPQ